MMRSKTMSVGLALMLGLSTTLVACNQEGGEVEQVEPGAAPEEVEPAGEPITEPEVEPEGGEG